jgi:hypothetical protein
MQIFYTILFALFALLLFIATLSVTVNKWKMGISTLIHASFAVAWAMFGTSLPMLAFTVLFLLFLGVTSRKENGALLFSLLMTLPAVFKIILILNR